MLTPMPMYKSIRDELRAIPAENFTRHWIGYATAERPYRPKSADVAPYWQVVQRLGESEQAAKCEMNAFICTHEDADVDEPVQHFPKRWHCEEFFNAYQALGWHRAGTQNLNIRFGQMSMALIAQTVTSMLRENLDWPIESWDAKHFARDYLGGLEGDVRVRGDTIVVTYYNAPEARRLAEHYTRTPARLEAEGVDPRIPWLYGYKLDFRFK